MRKILLALVFTCWIGIANLQAQTSAEVEKHLLEYFESISNKDYDTLYKILAPSIKGALPKDSIMGLLFMVESNPNFVNQMVDFDLRHSSDPVMSDDVVYCKIDYVAKRVLQYTDVATAEYIEKTNDYFKRQHPTSFVYHKDEKAFSTLHPASVIMCMDMKDEDNIVYFFIPYLDKLLPYMHYLMPQEAVDELLK